jgi:OOP family OmpA-OmpF porin
MLSCISRQMPIVLAALVVMLFAAPAPSAHAVLKPKIDNFFFLIDTSGSMGGEYKNTGATKFQLACKLAMRMNPLIPTLEYKGALATMAPFEMLQRLKLYSRTGFQQSLSRLPDNVRYWFGNPTPLGEGLLDLQHYLPEKNERTALILFSDGGSNRGRSPLPVAEGMYEDYGKNLCFHVISFAETSRHQQVLDSIAALSDCTLLAGYTVLQQDAELAQFVKQVFYTDKVVDTDGDGVVDPQDQCPGTPRNVQVDAVGCPEDSDQDGVYDSKDQCPGTPEGVSVDPAGCPLDSDGDGVDDYQDDCPRTPHGLKVDERGCPQPVTFNLKIEFDTGKAEVRPQYRDELKKAADFLKTHPGTTAVVEGHTDAVGSASCNKKLSQRRADSVMDYLVDEFGVSPGRLSAIGLGESKPIASNDTSRGRQDNRRVLIVVSGAYRQR